MVVTHYILFYAIEISNHSSNFIAISKIALVEVVGPPISQNNILSKWHAFGKKIMIQFVI